MSAAVIAQQQRKKKKTLSPKQQETLKKNAFKKGESGNPGGTKFGFVNLSDAYKRLMAMSPDDLKKFKPDNVTEEMALKQINRALCDEHPQSVGAVEKIADRTEGKPAQKVENSHSGTLEIVYVNDWRETAQD